ncbi:MAG: PDZ domain-containing protein [Gemmataceae bacterium]
MIPIGWAIWAIFAADALAFVEVRVRQPTVLNDDWILGADRLPVNYNSRRQRYLLLRPPPTREKRPLSLLLVLPAGDHAAESQRLGEVCREAGWAVAVVLGAGAHRPIGQRLRATLDVLDDAVRETETPPAAVTLLTLGENGPLGGRLAFSVPERFAAVVSDRDLGVPGLAHLRYRVKARLSIAFLGAAGDEELYRDLGIRAKRFDPTAWKALLAWIAEDRPRRDKDAQAWPDDRPLEQQLEQLLAQARIAQTKPAEHYLAAALLEWLHLRYGSSKAGREARALYEAWRTQPREGRRLAEVVAADRRPVERALARAAERAGQLELARARWSNLIPLTPDPEEKELAQEHIRRLDVLLEQRPYLGLTLVGDTNRVREAKGPAQRAGLLPGDRLEKIGEVPIRGPEDLRRLLERLQPGVELAIEIHRGDERRLVNLTTTSRKQAR